MNITEKLNRYINTIEGNERVEEKEFQLTASDSMNDGKITINLNDLPREYAKTARKKLKQGDFSVDDIANLLVINL